MLECPEHERDLEGVTGPEHTLEGRRLPREQVGEGADPGVGRRRVGVGEAGVPTRNTTSVAIADHRSRGSTGSPRASRAARTVATTPVRRLVVGGDPPDPVTEPVHGQVHRASGCRATKKADSSRLVPMSRGTAEAEPRRHRFRGGTARSPPSTTGVISSPASALPPDTSMYSARGRHQPVGGHAGEGLPGAGHAEMGGQPLGPIRRELRGAGVGRPALDDGPVEEAGGIGDGQERRHAHAAGGLAEDASRCPGRRRSGDVVPHPGERGDLVGQPPVAGTRSRPSTVEPRLAGLVECRDGRGSRAARAGS